MKRYTIDPITRLEGHGKIEIFCNDDGDVENVYFQVPELRGFEKFCEGRPVEELSQIVTKICGVCPGCHHMASGKAADAVYGVTIPSTARKLRELFYMAHFIHSHIAHFYALAAPDFVVGPTAKPEERNILGVIAKVGKEVGTEVIKQRRLA
jgi:F420-non-reducing hydrogenase large subunit